jgi:MFS family permease
MKRSVLAPFSVRSYRYQWPADLAASWAFEMEVLILGWFVLVESGSVFLLVVYGSLQFIGAALSPFIGVLGDRWGYKTLFIAMRVVFVLISVVLLLLAAADMLTPLLVIALAVVVGVLRPCDITIRFALIGQALPANQLIGALGISRITVDSARMAGALFGVGIFAAFGLVVAYVMITAMYLACLLLSFGVAGADRTLLAKRTPSSPLQDLQQGFRYVSSKPELVGATSLAFWINVFAYPIGIGLLPYVANNVYQAPQAMLGWLGAAYAFGSLVGSLVVSSNRIAMGSGRLMIVSAAIWFSLGGVFAFNEASSVGIVLLVLMGFVQSLCVTPLVAVMLQSTEPSYRGRVMGIRILAILGLPIGLMLSGPLIELIGFGGTISLYSLVGLLGALSMVRLWRTQLWLKTAPANQSQSL